MPFRPFKGSWWEPVRATAYLLREGLAQFLGFEILFRFLGAAIFAPLTAWLAAQLIAWSGDGAVSNYDLAAFFLSAKGLVYLTAVLSVSFALTFLEFGGLLGLATAILQHQKVRLPQLARFLALSLPGLWRLSVRQFLLYLACAVPCLAVAGVAYRMFLTQSDINYYLQARPPEFYCAAGIAGAAAVAFAAAALRLFIDWIYSVPLLLFAGKSPGQALAESRRLVSGHRWKIVRMLLLWLAWVACLSLLAGVFLAALEWALLGLAGRRVSLVLTLTAALAVVQFLAASLVTMLSFSTLGCAVARRFHRLRPDFRLPNSLSGREHARLKRVAAFLRTGWAALLIFGSLTTYSAVRLAGAVRMEDHTGVTAHRGSSLAAPENTMAAILQAVDDGADFVEIDVQETKDGTVILAHDKDLKRVFGIGKGVWEVTYDDIKELDSGGWFSPAFSNQRIATLPQVIDAVHGRAKLNIELKFNGHEQKLASEAVRLARERRFLDQCIFTSLDYRGILRARAADPAARTGVIVTSSLGDITRLQAHLLSVNAKAVTRDLIDRAHSRGLEVHVWTVNDVPLMNTLISLGVDQIITDDPKLLREVLTERAALSNAEKVLLQLAEFAELRF